MPRFYFDLHNDVETIDPEGKKLPDVEAAKKVLLAEVREMIQASVENHGKIDLRHYIDLRDEAGTIVQVMHFEDALTVTRGESILSEPSKFRG